MTRPPREWRAVLDRFVSHTKLQPGRPANATLITPTLSDCRFSSGGSLSERDPGVSQLLACNMSHCLLFLISSSSLSLSLCFYVIIYFCWPRLGDFCVQRRGRAGKMGGVCRLPSLAHRVAVPSRLVFYFLFGFSCSSRLMWAEELCKSLLSPPRHLRCYATVIMMARLGANASVVREAWCFGRGGVR